MKGSEIVAFGFFKKSTQAEGKEEEVTVQQLLDAASGLKVKELALEVCANMVANAVAKCEFKTFMSGVEVREEEYYTLNICPNKNQNSTVFWQEVVYKLITQNECLVVAVVNKKGAESLIVADSWEVEEKGVIRDNVYKNVIAGDMTFKKTFHEPDVLHLRWNNGNVMKIVKEINEGYNTLLKAAKRSYTRSKGEQLKVKINQLASAQDDFQEKFQKIMERQVKPYFKADNVVLPEFEGYEYSHMSEKKTGENVGDIQAIAKDIFSNTARAVLIPPVLVTGDVADSKDAMKRWITVGIDPLVGQIEEELTRKRYGYDGWAQGNFVSIDTSTILHFDMFENASNIEKLIGSGCFSINDVLRAAKLPEIKEKWADQHWLTLNIADIKTAAQVAEGKEG